VTAIVRRTRITRLGEGVDTRRQLLPGPIARVRNALVDYHREAEELGAKRILAVATSAVRDAGNGEAFLGELEWSYGFDTRLLTGDEEAALTLRGAGPLSPGMMIVDVGGGSTELITETFRRSLDIGAVRLTERFGADTEAAVAQIQRLLPPLHAETVLGVDGSTAEVTGIAGACEVAPAEVAAILERLRRATPDERRLMLPHEPERESTIVAGVLVLVEVLRHVGAKRLVASERDLLDGVALAAAELPPRLEGDAPPGAFTCC